MGLSPAIHVLGRPMAVPGPFFFEAPTETVGRRPCSHGGGPLRELDGQCPPSPIAGSPVPCSALAGAAPEHQRYAGTHRPPAQRLPPSATGPREGGPLATDRLCSGASPAACGVTSGQRRFPSLPAWLGLTPPVPARRSAAVPAPHRLRTGLRPGSGSSGSLGPTAHPWAAPCGPAARPPRRCGFASGPSAPRRSGSPQDGPARALPSLVPRSVGRLGGLRAPLLPPGAWERPCGPLLYGPGPRRREQMQSGACLWILAGASRAAPSGFVSAVSADSISIYRKSFCKL